MTQDPTLFTALEWVLLAMTLAISLLLYLAVQRARHGSPFAERDECWSQNGVTTPLRRFPRREAQ